MAQALPFKGFHPRQDNAERVVSRSPDAYSREMTERILSTVPESFLHVVRPGHGIPQRLKPNTREMFMASKQRFMDMVGSGALMADPVPCFYIYTQYRGRESYTGIIACAAAEDYLNGTIRIHEQTIAHREKLLKDYLEVCDINAEPVCLTHPRTGSLELLTEIVRQDPPLLDFKETDGTGHQLWRVDSPQWVAKFQEKLGLLPAVYIADGHHRTASSVLLAREHWEREGRREGGAPHDWFMAIFFPDDQLRIMEYNRVVTDLGSHTPESLLQALRMDFEVDSRGNTPICADSKGHIGMYVGGRWHCLTYRHPVRHGTVGALDVSILSDRILSPLLGITDLRNDPRIGFMPGTKGTQALQRAVDSGRYAAAFALHPVSGEEFYAISDQGMTMPPKSTYIVPKLLSGLVVYSLSHT